MTMLPKRLGLALVLALVTALVVAACGGGDDDNAMAPTAQATNAAPQPTAPPTPTPLPVPSGELIVALDSLSNFEVLISTSATSKTYMDAMYDYFIGATDDRKLDPKSGLITSWTASSDQKMWTFKTRDGVVFHNGDKASAADVKGWLDRIMAEGSKVITGSTLRQIVKSAEAPDAGTFIVTLNSPGLFWPTSYLSRVGSAAGAQHLIPNDYVNRVGEAGANKSPVGSGPYKFKNLIAGSSIEFEAVDKYWYYGVPRVKSLTFSHIPEEGTRIALLKTNGADLAPISKSQAAAMKKEPNLKTFLRGDAGAGTYRMEAQFVSEYPGYGKNPLANVEVRRALDWHAIDRQVIVDKFLYGFGKPASGLGGAVTDDAYLPIDPPTYDPAKAKQMIAAAGWPNGFEADFYIWARAGYPEGVEIMEALAQMFEAVGVKISLRPLEYSAWFGLITGDPKYKKPSFAGSYLVGNRPAYGAAIGGSHNPASFFAVNHDTELNKLAKAWAAASNLQDYISTGQIYQKTYYEQVAIGGGGASLFTTGETFAASAKVPSSWNLGQAINGYQIEKMAASRSLS